jgi:hypothetical protein
MCLWNDEVDMREIKISDKLLVGTCNFSTKLEDLREVSVVKAGNKYITVLIYGREVQFYADTLLRKTDLNINKHDKLFFSKNEYSTRKKFVDKVNNICGSLLKVKEYNLKNWKEEDLDSLKGLLEKYK